MGQKTKKKIAKKMKSKVKAIGGKKKAGKVNLANNTAKAKAAQKERIEKLKNKKAKPKVSKPKLRAPLTELEAAVTPEDGTSVYPEPVPYEDDTIDDGFDEQF